MSTNTVLVTDGITRSSLAVVRSLGKRDIRVICVASTRFATAFFSNRVDERVVIPSPEKNPEKFTQSLLEFTQNRDIDVLIPVAHETTREIASNRSLFSEYTRVATCASKTFEKASSKATIIRLARKLGIPHPKTYHPNSLEEAKQQANDLGFPLVVKPLDSFGSRGLKFIESADEFADAYRTTYEKYEKPLLQERIPEHGDGIASAFVLDSESNVCGKYAYRRIREYPPSGGPSTLRETINCPDIISYGEKLLKQLDYTGPAMVEFKMDPRDNTPKLMEINPRLWGSLHLPYHAGLDIPWLTYKITNGYYTREPQKIEIGIQCRYLLPGDFLHLLSVRDRETLSEFFPVWAGDQYFDIICLDDPLPVVGRLLMIGRFLFDIGMWKKVVFRSKS